MADMKQIMETLINGDRDSLVNLVQTALDSGVEASEILGKGLIKGMDIVGERMKSGEMFIPEVLRSAKTMAAVVEILKPLLGEDSAGRSGKIVIGTVKGDLHDIGKNLVKLMLEGAGYDVIDLGIDVEPAAFVQALNEKKANVVAMSALLTTTMPMMQQTINAIMESGMRDDVKIFIGGAPVTQKFADEIGADGYASDAGSATQLAKTLLR